jgi:hypothetical protein
LPTATLTLQLVFNPQNPNAPFGRFSKYDSTAPTTLQSEVWILVPVTGPPSITRDKNASVQVLNSDPNSPTVQIGVIGNLPTGWAFATGDTGYAMRITAVFGRAHHAAERDQSYASPFSVGNQGPSPSTVFDKTYSLSDIVNNQCLLVLGVARLHSAPPAPVLSSINPATFPSQAGSIGFTIAGQNLSGATLQWSAGVTPSISQITATQITGSLVAGSISGPSQAGSVSAVVNGQTSNALPFTIEGSVDAGAEPGPAGNAGGGGKQTAGKDIYEFNVGVTAYLSNGGAPAQVFMFGHDPDMEVGD